MRNTFVLTVVLLASLAWAVAQQGSTSQSAPPASSSSQATGSSATSSAQSGSQGTSSTSSAQDMQGEQGTVTTGCLAGTAPNFTITTASGTTYKLVIPASADTSKLAQHVGDSVDVRGKVSNGGGSDTSSMANPGSSSAMGSQPPAAGANAGAGAAGAGAAGAGSTGAGASSSNQPTIAVNGIRQGSGTCPGSTAKPTPK